MWKRNSTMSFVFLATISHLFMSCSCYTCDSGCEVDDSFFDDGYCDCPDCDDEIYWTCATCGCPSNADCGDDWYSCNDTSIYVCSDGCEISIGFVYDGYCDCSNCEDEPDWTCSTCGCSDFCGVYYYCNGTVDGWSGFYCEYDDCEMTGDRTNDNYCDCSDCADEENFDCSTCADGCPTQSIIQGICGNANTWCGDGITTTGMVDDHSTTGATTATGDSSTTQDNGGTSGGDDDDEDDGNDTILTQIGNLDKAALAVIIIGFVMVLILLCLIISRLKCVRDRIRGNHKKNNGEGGNRLDNLNELVDNQSYGLSSTADTNNAAQQAQQQQQGQSQNIPAMVAGVNPNAACQTGQMGQMGQAQGQQMHLAQQMQQLQRLQLMQQQLAAMQAQQAQGVAPNAMQMQQIQMMSTLGPTTNMPMNMNMTNMAMTNAMMNTNMNGFGFTQAQLGGGGQVGEGGSSVAAAAPAAVGMMPMVNMATMANGAALPMQPMVNAANMMTPGLGMMQNGVVDDNVAAAGGNNRGNNGAGGAGGGEALAGDEDNDNDNEDNYNDGINGNETGGIAAPNAVSVENVAQLNGIRSLASESGDENED